MEPVCIGEPKANASCFHLHGGCLYRQGNSPILRLQAQKPLSCLKTAEVYMAFRAISPHKEEDEHSGKAVSLQEWSAESRPRELDSAGSVLWVREV